MSIPGIGPDPLRDCGQVGRPPLLGQQKVVASPSSGLATATNQDHSTLSPELGESEGGANALLAAWGSNQPKAAAPSLAIEGIKPGAQAGFSINGGSVGGLQPGMQAGVVMLGPVFRS